MVHRCLILASILFVNTVLAFAKDRIEIVDLSTGTKQELQTENSNDSSETILSADDRARCVYTLKAEERNFTLRKISYDAKLLDEKQLSGFECYEAGGDHGFKYLCALSPKADRLVACGYGDEALYIYNIADASKKIVPVPPSSVSFLTWASDNHAIAVIARFRAADSELLSAVVRIDASTGQTEVIYKDDCLVFGTEAADISPDKRFLAVYCGPTNDVRIIDLQQKKLAVAQRMRRDTVDFVQWSPDGKYLAYMVTTAGRLDISAMGSDGSIATTTSQEIRAAFWNMFFLDANTLVCLTSNISGRMKYKLAPLKLDTGQWGADLPYTERSKLLPIDDGKKLFSIVSDSRNELSSNSTLPVIGHPALALALPILIDGMSAAHPGDGPSVGIIDVEKGSMKIVKAGDAWMENVIGIDETQKAFATLHVTEKVTSVRTISYSGDVLETKILPDLHPTGPNKLLRFIAYSMENKVFVYYDDIKSKAIHAIDLKTGEKTQIVNDLDVEMLHMAWFDPKSILLVINADWSNAQTFANTIAVLNTDTKKVDALYKSPHQFLRRGPSPSSLPQNEIFALSPDRRQFLFTQQSAPAGGNWSTLHVLDLQTKQVHDITPQVDEVEAHDGCWSPDGKEIAYLEQKRTPVADRAAQEAALLKDIEKLSKKPVLTPEEFRTLQKVSDTLGNLPMFVVTTAVKSASLDGQQTIALPAIPEAWFALGLAHLGNANYLLSCDANLDDNGSGTDSVFLLTGTAAAPTKILKGKWITYMIPVDGGRFVLCHL